MTYGVAVYHAVSLGGPPLVDRAAHRRATVDVALGDAILATSGAVVLEGDRLSRIPADARPTSVVTVFLGEVAGRDLVALHPVDMDMSLPLGASWVPLREALSRLSRGPDGDAEWELASAAVAMLAWHERHPVCARCGGATLPRDGGWMRRCVEDEHDHYPRTDPAVIVAITDESDRLLLAHVAYHSPGRYSHLAGYVEPGESFEHAAHREIMEEGSLRLADLQYVGSQPWPFPASVMVAYTATAVAAELRIDAVEVTDARWFTRAELVTAVASREIVLAPSGSIARRLIHDWFGGDPERATSVGPT